MRTRRGLLTGAVTWIGVMAFACGGGSGAVGASADAGARTGSDGGAPPTGTPDAGGDVDQDPNVYPAQHAPIAQIDFLDGPTLVSPRLVTITFVSPLSGDGGGAADASTPAVDDAGESDASGVDDGGPDAEPLGAPDPYRDAVRQFVDTLPASDWWGATLAHYGVGTPTEAFHADLALPASFASTTDDALQIYLAAQIHAGILPAPDGDTAYLFFLPPTVTITLVTEKRAATSCVDFDGYHGDVAVELPDGTSPEAAYAVIVECPHAPSTASSLQPFDFVTITASHEIAETATDPFVYDAEAFYLSTNDPWMPGTPHSRIAGGEVADMCTALATATIGSTTYTVSSIWVNGAAAASEQPCRPAADPTRIFYGAAVSTPLQEVDGVDYPFNFPHESRGYLLLGAGGSATTEVDFFSQAPLSNDVTLLVGAKPVFGEAAPSAPQDIDPIPSGITATLSKTTVHNGDGLWLTVDVASPMAKGDYDLVVRSILDANDFNDWPFTVQVQ